MNIKTIKDGKRLLIEFTNEERAALQEEMEVNEEHFNDLETLEYFLLEPALEYGYGFIAPMEFADNTDSPMLHLENNKNERWGFMRFDHINPLEELLNLGFVVFDHHEIINS